MKGREWEIGQTQCHVISSHSLCERIIQTFDNREIQPSQISLDARYSMKCLVWREAVCELCDLRDQPASFFTWCQRNWCDTLLYSVSGFIIVLSASTQCPKRNVNQAWNPSGWMILQWFMSTPEAFAKSLCLFTLLEVCRPRFQKPTTWVPLYTYVCVYIYTVVAKIIRMVRFFNVLKEVSSSLWNIFTF